MSRVMRLLSATFGFTVDLTLGAMLGAGLLAWSLSQNDVLQAIVNAETGNAATTFTIHCDPDAGGHISCRVTDIIPSSEKETHHEHHIE